jgi:hypothetical protein
MTVLGGRHGMMYEGSWIRETRPGQIEDVLNAAGTPMIKPLPLSSLRRLTLWPGEFSTRSTSGSGSPTATHAGDEVWKDVGRPTASRGSLHANVRAGSMMGLGGGGDWRWQSFNSKRKEQRRNAQIGQGALNHAGCESSAPYLRTPYCMYCTVLILRTIR